MQRSFDFGREILKWIALATMTVDHIGAIVFPKYTLLRVIGRVSFPLFSYLLVLGMRSTRNARNYVIRLFAFALISQVPFSVALGYPSLTHLNIFFTLSLGLLSLLQPLLILPSLFIAESLNFDYGAYGIALIACMYILNNNTRNGIISITLLNAVYLLLSLPDIQLSYIQMFSLLALPIILLYKRGYLKIERKDKGNTAYPSWRSKLLLLYGDVKYFFYVYYPLHLSIIYLAKTYILKM